MESRKLQLTHYKKKGIYAYLCRLTINGSSIVRGDFINGEPIDEGENKQRFYQGRSATVVFDLGKFPDGLYEYKEAVKHKSRRGYLQISQGQIKEEWSSPEEMMDELKPVPELPDLLGTNKQVAWAETIREKAIRDGFPVEEACKITSASQWINSRK